MLEGSSIREARLIGDRLLALFHDKPLPYGQHQIRTSLSIGIAEFKAGMRNVAELFNQADFALYASTGRRNSLTNPQTFGDRASARHVSGTARSNRASRDISASR